MEAWAAIALTEELPKPDPFPDIPRLVLLFEAPQGAQRCLVCGQRHPQVARSSHAEGPIGACTSPPPDEILAALRSWCRSLGLDAAAAVLRRRARRPYRPTPAGFAPLVLLDPGETLDDLGAHPRRSLADLATVIRATGPALGEQMSREEWHSFQEQLLDRLWR